jgi:hypothetical protein
VGATRRVEIPGTDGMSTIGGPHQQQKRQ